MRFPIPPTAAGTARPLPLTAVWLLVSTLFTAVAAPAPPLRSTGLELWDTGAVSTEPPDLAARGRWRAVPRELLALEKDPAKASSDPGYYGREYTFQGDAVLETPRYAILFSRGRHEIRVFGASSPTPNVVATAIGPRTDGVGTARLELIRYAGDEVRVRLEWGPEGRTGGTQLTCAVDAAGIVELQTGGEGTGVRLVAPMEYGVVPAFIGDDLLISLSATPGSTAGVLHLPSEQAFVGLLKGGATTLQVSWPSAEQTVALRRAGAGTPADAVPALEIGTGTRSVFLALESAPGLWFRQPLTAKQLEQDVALEWRRPFPARWKTQLLEEGVRTTFTFREAKGEIWRGVPGSYDYPAWFAGERAFLHPSKKVPPKG